MQTLTYRIEFFSYWHIGSGLTGSTYADGLVLKDTNGLPIIPGKILKGLLREAAETLNQLAPDMVKVDFINHVFGSKPKKVNGVEEDTNKKEDAAQCFFRTATLSQNLVEKLRNDANLKAGLYQTLASTAIDDEGQALTNSLRLLEVSVPLVLYATIEDFPSHYQEQLNYCLKWVKQMGINRNRGLGRCQFTIYK